MQKLTINKRQHNVFKYLQNHVEKVMSVYAFVLTCGDLNINEMRPEI